MSWEDINNTVGDGKKQAEESKQRAIALAKNYHACFTSEAGTKVLEHLVNTYIVGNETSLNAQNVLYEAGYHNGEAGIVKMILKQIERAKTL